MDSVEKSARKSHGNFMYNLIWKARMGDQKWLWFVVFIVSCAQLLATPLILGAISHSILKYGEEFFFERSLSISLLQSLLFICLIFPLIESSVKVSDAFKRVSQFISIAGDMNRIAKGGAGIFVKFLAKIGFLLSGVIALYCALSIWVVYRKKLKALSVTELDVLGNALSNGKKFWKQAGLVYAEISHRYAERFKSDVYARQIAISYGLASKWMYFDPGNDQADRIFYKKNIRQVIKDYPDLPEEVLIRYREILVLEDH